MSFKVGGMDIGNFLGSGLGSINTGLFDVLSSIGNLDVGTIFGTGTSADNFYAITGVDMTFSPGEFKCGLKLTLRDAFGSFVRIRDNALNILVSMLRQQDKFKLK